MPRLPSLILAAAFAAVALPAAAQQQPPRPNPPPVMQSRVFPDRPYVATTPWVRAQYETFLDASSGNNIPAQSLERVELANRVSTLIELGRCTEARIVAGEAGDRQMAIRARQLCRVDRPRVT